MQALGDELCPDEDVGAAAFKVGDHLRAGPLARGGVAVEAQHLAAGKSLADLQLQALSAGAGEAQFGGAARRAGVRR